MKASDLCWGTALRRIENNTKHFYRYAFGSFKQAELNYHSNVKELLAIKNGARKLNFFLLPKELLVRNPTG